MFRLNSIIAMAQDGSGAGMAAFALVQALCVATTALVAFAIVAGAPDAHESTDGEDTCTVDSVVDMRVVYFALMFFAGAALNCKEFLSMPLF